MKTPKGLQPLIDDGIIDEVLRPLKSGKEASVYVVSTGADILCAKVYKDMAQRSFQARVQYQEGRKVRGSRQARAMGKATKFGRREAETAWKNTEAEVLYQLMDASVHVPKPRGYFHGVLLMDLVTDEAGHSAPRLGEVELEPEQARVFHTSLIGDVVKMLSLGLVHGDLSEYNVLVSPEGPVLIDFPRWSAPPATMPRATCCCATCTTCAIVWAVLRRSCWKPTTAKRCGRCSKGRAAPGQRADRTLQVRHPPRRRARHPCLDRRRTPGKSHSSARPRGGCGRRRLASGCCALCGAMLTAAGMALPACVVNGQRVGAR